MKENSIKNKNLEYPSQLNSENIGEFHNIIMAIIYDEVINCKSYPTNEQLLEEGLAIVKAETMSILNISSSEYDQELSDLGFPLSLSPSSDFDGILQSLTENALIEALNIDQQLGADLEFLLDSTINRDDPVQFVTELDVLKSNYEGTQHEEMVNSIVSIAESSYNYWTVHADKWNKDKISQKAKAIISADVSGAIVGALSGAITGGGAILGAAIGAPYSSSCAGLFSAFW